jgi:hypothetical protein
MKEFINKLFLTWFLVSLLLGIGMSIVFISITFNRNEDIGQCIFMSFVWWIPHIIYHWANWLRKTK